MKVKSGRTGENMKLESPKLYGSVGRFAMCIRKNADFLEVCV